MKHVYLLAGAALALILAACGGSSAVSSSGNGSSTAGNTGGLPVAPAGTHIEAQVSNPTTFDNGSSSNGQQFIIQDPQDIEAQDQITFELVYEDSTGRHVLPTNNWASTDTHGTFGTLIYNSGAYSANTAQTTTPETVSTSYNGQNYSLQYDILPRQVRLRGQIIADDSKVPLGGVEVDFYGPANPLDPTSPLVFRGRVITAFDGTFRASIPDSTTNFQLANDSLPAGYQRYFRFKSNYYHTGDITCYAPLPAFSNGERFLIDYTNSKVTANGTILLLSNSESVPSTACGGAAP